MRRWAERRSPGPAWRGRGLLDTAIVICLLALFLLVASQRLLPLRGDAEAAHIETIIGGLRSALGLTTAEIIIRQGADALHELGNSNPIDLLEEAPQNYLGTVTVEQHTDIPSGNWYFLADSGWLGYRIRHRQHLPDAPTDLIWRIEVQYSQTQSDDAAPRQKGHLQSVRLERVFDLNQTTSQ